MRTGRIVLSGMFGFAVRRTPMQTNPVRETKLARNIAPKGRTAGAGGLTIDQLRFILSAVRTSQLPCPRKLSKAERQRGTPVKAYTPPTVAEYCEGADLVDIITVYAATGLRRSQMLGTDGALLDHWFALILPMSPSPFLPPATRLDR
ncbi:hypothetical protein ACFV24_15895 [Nocardia fluminea]|uniref:hypothetical protein n=1 Tax=Nocardia fluminea TaxID=134984 RepID=UPI00366D7C56